MGEMKNEKQPRHKTISLPTELIEEGNKLIQNENYKGGYRSFSELAADSVRRRLKEIRDEIIEAQKYKTLFELGKK